MISKDPFQKIIEACIKGYYVFTLMNFRYSNDYPDRRLLTILVIPGLTNFLLSFQQIP
jgi:hypothetical protein